MKPKNKFQRNIVEASKSLQPLTSKQIQWGLEHSINHVGHKSAKKIVTCTKCGHQWKSDTKRKHEKCPHCGTRLTIHEGRKRIFNDCGYFTVITACKDYQVVRSVMVKCSLRVGKPAEYEWAEVMQRWIAPNGEHVTFTRLRQTMGTLYYDLWLFCTPLELRKENHIFNLVHSGTVCPFMSVTHELRKRGFKKSFYGQSPLNFFHALLTDNRMETLLKTGQTKLLRHFMERPKENVEDYWQSIRICNRNGYKVHDAVTWCDYIDALKYLGKDVRNMKYVCPQNLSREHDKACRKVVERELEKEMNGNTPKFLSKEHCYLLNKGRFFGLSFSDGVICVKVIESVRDMILEGRAMHHCVGGYHTKKDSLILSATINGKRIETVEVSLSQMKVVQCRGVCNSNTKYHDRIIKLVEDNAEQIRQRMKQVA
jgi:DNA-directed RNA polymerase subunit RPC12/RpoP